MSRSITPIHLVGSVPLDGPREVFRTVGQILGQRIDRIPDGETGVRSGWIRWQRPLFANHPSFEPTTEAEHAYHNIAPFRLRADTDASRLSFGSLGYSAAARDSYAIFQAEKQAGNVHPDCRFQISLPTPLAPVAAFVRLEDQLHVEQRYADRLLSELDEIVAVAPASQLAIQWDVAREFMYVEGVMAPPFDDVFGEIARRLQSLSSRVPDDVELGLHLCYGDSGHKHFVEPSDATNLVKVANLLSQVIERPIAWIHMPVPIARDDAAYFEPLSDLRLHPETTLFLGLVHLSDGIEGGRRRIRAAHAFYDEFGIATECGFGRRPPETVPDLLRLHLALASG
jgi:hypothetical protein